LREVVEEHAEKANGAELHRKTDAIVGTAQQRNGLAVGAIEVKVAANCSSLGSPAYRP
jgi:hypothetical protein